MDVSCFWRRTLSCLSGLVLFTVHDGTAAPRPSPTDADEYSVRAAIIVNLARFALWSEPLGDQFAICVSGEPAFAAALSAATQGKKIGDRPVRVQRLTAPVDEVDCRVLYIGRDERHVSDLLVRTSRGVLTISDRSEFVQDGGHVRLFLRDQRLRFEINQQAAERAGIKIPAQVMALSSR